MQKQSHQTTKFHVIELLQPEKHEIEMLKGHLAQWVEDKSIADADCQLFHHTSFEHLPHLEYTEIRIAPNVPALFVVALEKVLLRAMPDVRLTMSLNVSFAKIPSINGGDGLWVAFRNI